MEAKHGTCHLNSDKRRLTADLMLSSPGLPKSVKPDSPRDEHVNKSIAVPEKFLLPDIRYLPKTDMWSSRPILIYDLKMA